MYNNILYIIHIQYYMSIIFISFAELDKKCSSCPPDVERVLSRCILKPDLLYMYLPIILFKTKASKCRHDPHSQILHVCTL